MKLAIVAALLVSGACVANEPDSTARVETTAAVGPLNVIDQVELPSMTPNNVDFAVVTITGVEIPGRVPTQPHIDITNVDTADMDPELRRLCAIAATLPTTDVCSALCDPQAFAARMLGDSGEGGSCQNTRCTLPGDIGGDADVCATGN